MNFPCPRRFLVWLLSLFLFLARVQPFRPVSNVVGNGFSSSRSIRLWDRHDKMSDELDKSKVNVHESNAKEESMEYNDDEKDGVTLEEMDWETAQLEQQQANRVWFSLMAPYEISRYVTTALWVLVAVGYLLNFMGYAYVWEDGQLTIDTLAQRHFQDELARGLRDASRNGPH